MVTTNLFEDNYIPDPNKKYHLSILVGKDSFTYALMDTEKKEYIGLKSFSIQDNKEASISEIIKSQINTDQILALNFESINVLYESFRTMLVPESLFDSKNLKAFLKFHHEVDEKDHINFIELKSIDAFSVFTIPTEIGEALKSLKGEIKYYHHSNPLVYRAIADSNNDNMPTLHIYFATDFFDVLIVKNKKIQLSNAFFYKKYTDVLYFIINILNLYSLKPDTTKLCVSGKVVENSEIINEMKKLFTTICFDKFSLDFQYNTKFHTVEEQLFANQINLYTCEL